MSTKRTAPVQVSEADARGERKRVRALEYMVLDVFAERRFEGNPLAVFMDGTGLRTEDMQTIACELNLSETTFVLPRTQEAEHDRGVRVRIFTTEEELPFAGHPTLGTASALRLLRPELQAESTVRLETNVGPIPVVFDAEEPGRDGMFGTMRQNDPVFYATEGADWPTREEFAEALGLQTGEIGLEGEEMAPVQVVSTGSAFCVVPLRSLEVASRLAIPQAKARPLLRRIGARFFYCVTRAAAGAEAAWHGRMQFSSGEDPATGSAAGCVAGWLVQHGLMESGRRTVLEQGVEIGRPSRLVLQAALGKGGVTEVFVGGRTIPVASGRLFLPDRT